jgi:hypothetical protein
VKLSFLSEPVQVSCSSSIPFFFILSIWLFINHT